MYAVDLAIVVWVACHTWHRCRSCCVLPARSDVPLLLLQSKSTPNAQDAYLATVIIGAAGTKASSKAACASLIATAGSSSASMLEASFALRAAHAIGCDNVVTAAVVSKVQAGLDTGRVSELYGAASSLRVLSAAKQGLSVSWAAIIDTVAELAEVCDGMA